MSAFYYLTPVFENCVLGDNSMVAALLSAKGVGYKSMSYKPNVVSLKLVQTTKLSDTLPYKCSCLTTKLLTIRTQKGLKNNQICLPMCGTGNKSLIQMQYSLFCFHANLAC